MENNTAKRRGRPSKAATASQTGSAIPETKTGTSYPPYKPYNDTVALPFRCSGDITIHSKTGDSGRTSYRVVFCKEDQNTGDPVFCSLWINFAKDAKTICGALPSNGKSRIRVNDAFLSVSLADGNPVLVILSAEILSK